MQKKDESEKRSTEGRRFSKIAEESIQNMAEVCGIVGMSDEMANRISEDVTYRLREVLHHASIFLRQSKRRKLLTSDILEVFEDYDVSPVYGHSVSESPDFVFVPEADVFVYDQGEENVRALAFDMTPLVRLGDLVIQDSKTTPIEEVPQIEPQTIVKMEVESVPSPSNTDDITFPIQLPPYLRAYYNRVASVMLGASQNHLEVIWADFYTNSKIGLIVPYLLNLMVISLQKLPIMRPQFLQCVSVLTQNKGIEFNSSLAVHRLVSALLLCALDIKGMEDISLDDDYSIRGEAALVLSMVVGEWCRGEKKLLLDIVQKLGSVLLNGNSPLKSHYGALECLVALGSEALGYCLWPHLAQYLSFLDTQPHSRDVKAVEGAILKASENLYQQECQGGQGSLSLRAFNMMDRLLLSYFGDALCTYRICSRVTTYEEDHTGSGTKTSIQRSYLRLAEGFADSSVFLDCPLKKPCSLQLLFSKKKKIGHRKKRTSKIIDRKDFFEIHRLYKRPIYGIEMNFAGGKPVPYWQLVSRQLDENHSRLIVHSPFFKVCKKTGFIGPHKSFLKPLSQKCNPKFVSSVGDILIVL